MKISVITVAYNAVDTIAETLESIAGQSHSDIEHIVIDGASSDGTLEVIGKYKDKIARYISESDRGIYDAMNKGLAMATGDVIAILNADDVYAHTQVLAQVADIFGNPDVDACYADLVYVDCKDPSKVMRYWKSRAYHDGLFEQGWMPAHPTFFVRRSVYQKYGLFDLDYRLQSDFELTMRFLAVHKIRSVYFPEVFIRMRTGGTGSKLVNIVRGNLEAYRACRKHSLNVSRLFILRKMMSRIPQFFLRR